MSAARSTESPSGAGLAPATAVRRPAAAMEQDACDRCLALSQLTVYLAKIPVLRHGEVEKDDGGEPVVLRPPLVADAAGLAPHPAQLARATVGVSEHRARSFAVELRDWSADAMREAAWKAGLTVLCSCSPSYPAPLHDLADEPPVIYVRGDLALLGRCPDHAISMVGTRHPTVTGRNASRRIAAGIGRTGGVVVSGMALGIDAAAHEGALSVGAPTIAVLASGADLATPGSNRKLYGQILDAGAVVSEMPPGCRPFVWGFPARNRIIAALGTVTVVVEAPIKSGALITVEQAMDLGRDTYAVPGSLASDVSEGTNLMLQEGAGAVIDGAHLAGHLLDRDSAPRPEAPAGGPEAAIHAALTNGPLSSAELGHRTASSLAAAELDDVLLDLELAGWVARRPDGRYRIVDRYRP
ncbi:MAG: DNA-processing protein DprA [Solirubrobacteraceae bacterium]|nr:DNA-processing protein DprA [Solirubrobacteraceae bacterium]